MAKIYSKGISFDKKDLTIGVELTCSEDDNRVLISTGDDKGYVNISISLNECLADKDWKYIINHVMKEVGRRKYIKILEEDLA